LIEFNDGSLDLPRMKSKRPQPAEALAASATTVDITVTKTLWPLQLTWREPKQLL
jgi:hypothetical protein